MDTVHTIIITLAQVTSRRLPKATVDASLPNVLRIVSVIAALLSIIFIVIGGLKYTTSGGDSSGVQKAKNTILYAVIGLVVTLSAYVIIGFVTGRLL